MIEQPSPQPLSQDMVLEPTTWGEPTHPPQKTGDCLRLSFLWGDTLLDVGHFDKPQEVTLGPHSQNDFRVSMDAWDEQPYPILVKEGPFGYSFFFTDSFNGSYTNQDGETYTLQELQATLGGYATNGYQGFVLHLEPGDELHAEIGELCIDVDFVQQVPLESTPYAREREYLWWRVLSFSAIAHFCVILLFQMIPSGANALRPTQLLGRFSKLISIPVVEPPRKEKKKFKLEKKKPKPLPKVFKRTHKKNPNPTVDPKVTRTRDVKKIGVLGTLENFGSGKGDIFGKMNTQQWLGQVIASTGGQSSASAGFGHGRCFGMNCTGGEGGHPYGEDGVFGNRPGTRHYNRRKVGNLRGKKGKKVMIKLSPPMLRLEGSLSKEEIARVVRQNLFMIRFCYERALTKNPNLGGKIALRWIIAGSGYVQTVAVTGTTMNNERVENCLVRKVRRWKFPRPRGNGVVIVNYPFFFNKAS